jgi:hypothetical protein
MQSERIIMQPYACASYGLLSFTIRRPQMVVGPSLVNLQSVLDGGRYSLVLVLGADEAAFADEALLAETARLEEQGNRAASVAMLRNVGDARAQDGGPTQDEGPRGRSANSPTAETRSAKISRVVS